MSCHLSINLLKITTVKSTGISQTLLVIPVSLPQFRSGSCDADKAQLFNIYFHSVYCATASHLSSIFEMTSSSPSLTTLDFTVNEIMELLQSIDDTKAMGIDSINPKVLKHCAASLSYPIYKLFQLTFKNSKLPQEWKTHCIIPIHKSGDKSLVSNYRPISLLPIVSKVLERLVHQKFYHFY